MIHVHSVTMEFFHITNIKCRLDSQSTRMMGNSKTTVGKWRFEENDMFSIRVSDLRDVKYKMDNVHIEGAPTNTCFLQSFIDKMKEREFVVNADIKNDIYGYLYATNINIVNII